MQTRIAPNMGSGRNNVIRIKLEHCEAEITISLQCSNLPMLERRLNDLGYQTPLETFARFVIIAALEAEKEQSR